jgi:cytochrome P450
MTILFPPAPTSQNARAAWQALRTQKSLLLAMKALRDELGDVFLLSFPGFRAVVLSGPEAAHFTYVKARSALGWRTEDDPVTRLLRHGLLVEDGESHDTLRRDIMPYLHRQKVDAYLPVFIDRADQVCATWDLERPLDMLVEMRRVALLILMATLFDVEFTPDMHRLWKAILRSLKFISPGAWLVWPGIPRPEFKRSLREVDAYLYGLIAQQRGKQQPGDNLLARMIALGMRDALIRDQLLTLLIAGHDTSTALLTWAIYLLTAHPQAMRKAQEEVDTVLGNEAPDHERIERLVYLEQVINETLRLYPPIHVSNRRVLEDLEFNGYRIRAGERLMFSIYLTHHDKNHWPDAERFDPGRFAPGVRYLPYTFVPFGGGPRNCIGAAFAQVEAKAVLARLLQRYDFTLLQPSVRLYMGATLEPRPGVLVKAVKRF